METIAIGMDICISDVQVSIRREGENTVKPFYFPELCVGEVIPFALTYDTAGRCLIGAKALSYAGETNSVLYRDLLGLPAKEQTGELQKTGRELLSSFLMALMEEIHKEISDMSCIRRIGVTAERMNDEIAEHIRECFIAIGWNRAKLSFVSHADACLYYETAERTKRENGEILVLDYNTEGMNTYTLHFLQNKGGETAYVQARDYAALMPGDILKEQSEDAFLKCFDKTLHMILNRQEAKRLYVTGYHMTEDGIAAILQKIASGKRVFCGRGLYVLGAGYFAWDEKLPQGVMPEGAILFDVKLLVSENGVVKQQTLLSAGTGKNAVSKGRYLLVDENRINLLFNDNRTGNVIQGTMILDHLTEPGQKQTEVEISVFFPEPMTAVVQVRDKGFGSFYPSTCRITEQIFTFAG